MKPIHLNQGLLSSVVLVVWRVTLINVSGAISVVINVAATGDMCASPTGLALARSDERLC